MASNYFSIGGVVRSREARNASRIARLMRIDPPRANKLHAMAETAANEAVGRAARKAAQEAYDLALDMLEPDPVELPEIVAFDDSSQQSTMEALAKAERIRAEVTRRTREPHKVYVWRRTDFMAPGQPQVGESA